jgi:hypothetical protein
VHEQHKIYEAHYFLLRADECGENAREFSYNLSAFLTAARSVLQYALEEAKTKPGGQAWYDASVSAVPEVKFLKDKRDISVHERPVVPNRRFNLSISEHLVFGDSVHVTVTRSDGTVEPDEPPRQVLPTVSYPVGETSSTVSFFFPDWTGQDDVMSICITYINAIEDIVRKGRTLGYIT